MMSGLNLGFENPQERYCESWRERGRYGDARVGVRRDHDARVGEGEGTERDHNEIVRPRQELKRDREVEAAGRDSVRKERDLTVGNRGEREVES